MKGCYIMKKADIEIARKQAAEVFAKAGIVMNPDELANIEVADFGLNDVYHTGLLLVTYVNTDRYCGKEMVLLPGMTCPEHIHAPLPEKNYIGKQETFRCRYGKVYLYVEGEPTPNYHCHPVKEDTCYTVFHEIVLNPGEQYTIAPNTRHWFSTDTESVISEFSSPSFDELDIFTDKDIQRIPTIDD